MTETAVGLPFVKMHGSGNDFVLIDNREDRIPLQAAGPLAVQLCRRRLSIGADGMILIGQPPPDSNAEFSWHYFNADGSEGEMCGNGAMCGGAFANSIGACGNEATFTTPAGQVRAHLGEDTRVTIDLPDAGPVGDPVDYDDLTFWPVNVGVPHLVGFVTDADTFLDPAAFHQFGQAVRQHEIAGPSGANVNIVSLRPDGGLRMRTYERGVEAETLACGTGAVATSIVAHHCGMTDLPATVLTSSGMPLIVSFVQLGSQSGQIQLTGQAKAVSSGTILSAALA